MTKIKRNKKPGISAAQCYLARIKCAEYELSGMIELYGRDNMILMVKAIAAGNIDAVRKEIKSGNYYGGTLFKDIDATLDLNNKYHL